MLGIKNAKIILIDQIVEGNLIVENNTIKSINGDLSACDEVIDANGQYLAPGFIDTHTHGRGGCDTMDATFESLNTICKTTLTTGVTSFLPTTMTMPVDAIKKAIENVAENKDKVEGSKILGVHLEGPFFNKKYKGAQPESAMIDPTIDNYLSFVGNHQDLIKKISIAPELEHSDELIEYLKDKGTVVSVGHTNATFEEADHAYKLGATAATHTYNAMTSLTHRAPGVVGATFLNDTVYAELILDGLHVCYPAVKVLMQAKGYDKVTIVTDSLEAAGLPAGEYSLAGQPIFVVDGACRLASGTLAGSIAGLNDEVRNAIRYCNVPMVQAIKMASTNSAKMLGYKNLGEIKVGNIADLIIFDEDINIKLVILDGKVKEL